MVSDDFTTSFFFKKVLRYYGSKRDKIQVSKDIAIQPSYTTY